MAAHCLQNTYDHRLRALVHRTGDVRIATELGVPRSTTNGWLRQSSRRTITAEALSLSEQALQVEVFELRRRVRKLRLSQNSAGP